MTDQAFCPQCGAARLVGAAFCGTCGRKWADAAEVPAWPGSAALAPTVAASGWVAPAPANKRLRNIVIVVAVAILAIMVIGALGRPRSTTPAQQPGLGSDLVSLMSIDVKGCSRQGATGTVRNRSDVVVDVFVEVQFLDAGGVVVDNSLASVSGLRPGETGKWDAPRIDDNPVDSCRANVDNAFAQ